MAFVLLIDKHGVTMTHQQALALQKVLDGEDEGTPKQQAFARKVKKIYYGRQYTPSTVTTTAPSNFWWKN